MEASDFKILVVDDEEDLREIISELFEIFNFNVCVAASGNEAWNTLSKEEFDIVISDIRMPDGSGPELLEKIKNKDIYSPRVFFISGFYDFSLEEVFDMGADGLFAKPFDSTQLRNSVQKALKPDDELWTISSSYECKCEFELDFKSLAQAVEDTRMNFGRGGFYVNLENSSCETGDVIGFKINFEEGPIKTLQGMGRVLWKRDTKNKHGEPGLGVEILHLETPCKDKYIEWLKNQKFKAYIPKG